MYEEEPSAPFPSPSTKNLKCKEAEIKKDIDAITTDSDLADMGQRGKTMNEITVVIA